MNIRKFDKADIPALIKLFQANSPKYFDTSEEAGFISYLNDETEEYFVIEEDGNIIACGGVNWELDDNAGVISWDIVDPSHQGKGVGSFLTLYRIDLIKSKKEIKKIIVRTSQHTQDFYAKQGFDLKYVKEDYWAPGIDLVYMEMTV